MRASRRKLLGYAVLGWPPHAVAYIGLPVLVAAAADRDRGLEPAGWTSVLGVPFLAAGSALIGWAVVGHYRASPDDAQLAARPAYLATAGAYAVSRNPLYVGGAAMWMGWAVVLRSPTVVAVGLVLFGLLATVGVRYEERLLRRRLGPDYDAYVRRVPRWLGRPRDR